MHIQLTVLETNHNFFYKCQVCCYYIWMKMVLNRQLPECLGSLKKVALEMPQLRMHTACLFCKGWSAHNSKNSHFCELCAWTHSFIYERSMRWQNICLQKETNMILQDKCSNCPTMSEEAKNVQRKKGYTTLSICVIIFSGQPIKFLGREGHI